MKRFLLPLIVFCTVIITSCDDTTDAIGSSLTYAGDKLSVSASSFPATTKSVLRDSVVARSSLGYLGKIKDPETGAYITGHFMTQFHTLDDYTFPSKEDILSVKDGEVIADSVEVRLFFSTYYGDTLATMKCTLHEMSDYMKEGVTYYSNFSPAEEGMIKADGLTESRSYTLSDYSISGSDRWTSSLKNIHIPLTKEYKKDGKTYNNFGTYIMHMFYENPEYFHNSFTFTKNICPGFYIESSNGIGSIATIELTQLNVYFRYKDDGKEQKGVASFVGTEEVLQKTTIQQDKKVLEELVKETGHTYLKTPGGIFTEVTIPVDDIMKGHENDTINTARMTILRENNSVASDYMLSTPQTVLILPSDSLDNFFEKNQIADYRTSFLATYNANTNGYTFGNLSNMIANMYAEKQRFLKNNPTVSESQYNGTHENWNKAIIVPVVTGYTTIGSSSILTRVANDMSLTSTKLISGTSDPEDPKAIKISVIYSKFQSTK